MMFRSRAIFTICAVGMLCLMPLALGANTSTPAWTVEAVAVKTTATQMPVTPMNGREGLEICNEGPNKIWCGPTSAVTMATGRPIATGACWGLALSFSKGVVEPPFWCVTTVDQVSPGDSRVTQVR